MEATNTNIKPKTLAGLKQALKDIESDKSDFEYKEVTKLVYALREELIEKNKTFFEAYDKKISEIKAAIKEKEKEIKEKKVKKGGIPDAIQIYINRKYSSGIDFGYGGLKVKYVDPKNRFLIVTIKGGTAGQGTAMGTGGYYYANASHFVAFPQYGPYRDSKMPHSDESHGTFGNMFEIEGGKLTNEVKENLIKQANDYCEKYNVQPFKIDGYEK